MQSSKLFPVLGLGLFLLVNIIFAVRPLLSLYGCVKLLEYLFLGIYLAKTISTKMQLQHIAFLFAISTLFESSLAIAQYISQSSLNGIFYWFGERMFSGTTLGIANVSIAGDLLLRPYATFPHPNVLAGYLLLSMLFIWYFLPRSSRLWQLLFSSSLLLSSIALLLTFSRLPILIWALLVFCLFLRLVLVKLPMIKQKLFAISLLLIVCVVLAALPFSHELFLRFSQTSFTEESFVERSELLKAAVTMIQQHPWFGVGLNNFLPMLAPLQKPMPLNLYLQPVHNIFLLVTAETGIIGFGIFLMFLVQTCRRIMNYELRIRWGILCMLMVILVTGMFDHYWLTLQQGQLLFTIVLGLGWAKIKEN